MSDCVVDIFLETSFHQFIFSQRVHWKQRVALKSPLKKACQHSVAHASLRFTSPCAYPMCVRVLTHHIVCISLGAINSSLFSPQVILYHKVIKGETCNLGLSFKNAELQPLILSLLFWPEEFTKPFSEQYLQSLCVSPVRHVFMLTSTPCGNLRANVNISETK